MAIVKVSWSGGKDSTCALITHLEEGHYVKAVCYIPMFDAETPLLLRSHYDFIVSSAERLRAMGAEVHIVHGMTYVEYCTHVARRGKFKGQIFGFPCFKTGQCGFKRDSKLKALDVDIGSYDYEDVGIAYDEPARYASLSGSQRSILYERGITEADALQICASYEMLSPLYLNGGTRDGCALCPHAKDAERNKWFVDYPHVLPRLAQLEQTCKALRPDRAPLRGNRWFLED